MVKKGEGTFGAQESAAEKASAIKPPPGKKKGKKEESVEEPPPGCVYTADDIKDAFEVHDTNGDGFLDFSELRVLLVRNNSGISEKELRMLWRAVDADSSGRVEFDEFVNFVYGKKMKTQKQKWQDTFLAFSGRDEQMNKTEFIELCVSCGFVDDENFSAVQAEYVFGLVCKPDLQLEPEGFSKAMARIAKMKKMKKKDVTKIVTEAEGPSQHEDFGAY